MSLDQLPSGLPTPSDDGACDHLLGKAVPDVVLSSTSGEKTSLLELARRRTVIYCYPMTGRPDRPLPDGWEMIPGARGCTPQSCGFRDHHAELNALDVKVYGLSTQPSAYQLEAKKRLHLPFELLSDSGFVLTEALSLPTLTVNDLEEISPDIPQRLIKRLTLVLSAGRIEHVFYPVFPPDENAAAVITYLSSASKGRHTRLS